MHLLHSFSLLLSFSSSISSTAGSTTVVHSIQFVFVSFFLCSFFVLFIAKSRYPCCSVCHWCHLSHCFRRCEEDVHDCSLHHPPRPCCLTSSRINHPNHHADLVCSSPPSSRRFPAYTSSSSSFPSIFRCLSHNLTHSSL